MSYKITISITLRPSILDPQGKAARNALNQLGYAQITDVRIGKYIELWIEAGTEVDARSAAEAACQSLLANPVMEDYSILRIEEAATV